MFPRRNMPPSMIGNNGDLGGYRSIPNRSQSQNHEFDSNLMDEQLLQMDISNQQGMSDYGGFSLFEFGSSSDNHEESGEGSRDGARRRRKKRYHRHTQFQIQEMEAFFRECPHPDEKQRKDLSMQLGLEPLQVKFWFQNKRTQMKTQHERNENLNLRAENEKLRDDNMRYREALCTAACPGCGSTAQGQLLYLEHQLKMDNARLRQEIDRLSAIAARCLGKGVMNYPIISAPATPIPCVRGLCGNLFGGAADLLVKSISGPTEADKPEIIELAVSAMEELVQMAQLGEPLWKPKMDGSNITVLDEEEYIRIFPRGIGPTPSGFRREASRETAVVTMNHMSLVDILMDVNQWSTVFAGIVSRAYTIDVFPTGVAGNYNGALQVMTAELQVPTPFVPTRESYFVRYCKQQGEGTWAVVDVSLDNLRPTITSNCRRRPSGCLIQEMPNGYSKVVWVEHVEVDDHHRGAHDLYKLLVSSGHAFGAKRWVATLDRQCERLASAMGPFVPNGDVGVITSQEGKKNLLKLAERMVISFCAGVSASSAHTWTTLSGIGADDVRVMTRKSVDDPGRPAGIVLSAATSFWLPVSPNTVFDFLRDENSRSKWDILSNGGAVQEMAPIANGRDPGNCVSLLRVNNPNSSQSNILILQESLTDPTGSLVIYAPVDMIAMDSVLTGRDPNYVALLPSGFAIMPDGLAHRGTELGTNGSLLTVAFQILVESVPSAKLSVGSISTVNNLIGSTVERIRDSIVGQTPK